MKDILEDTVFIQQELTKSNRCWREHAKFYSELAKIVDLIPYSLLIEYYNQLSETLLALMNSSPDHLKKEACLLMATFIYNLPN